MLNFWAFLVFFSAVVVVLVVDVNIAFMWFFLHRDDDSGPQNEPFLPEPPSAMILLGLWRFFGGG